MRPRGKSCVSFPVVVINAFAASVCVDERLRGRASGPGLPPLHQRRPAVVGHLDARLRSNSRKNRIYKVFREVGRSVRTVALLRYLAIREVMVGPQANRVGAAEEAAGRSSPR